MYSFIKTKSMNLDAVWYVLNVFLETTFKYAKFIYFNLANHTYWVVQNSLSIRLMLKRKMMTSMNNIETWTSYAILTWKNVLDVARAAEQEDTRNSVLRVYELKKGCIATRIVNWQLGRSFTERPTSRKEPPGNCFVTGFQQNISLLIQRLHVWITNWAK